MLSGGLPIVPCCRHIGQRLMRRSKGLDLPLRSVYVWPSVQRWRPMNRDTSKLARDEKRLLLIASIPAAQHRRAALAVVVFLSVVFAIVIPFAFAGGTT